VSLASGALGDLGFKSIDLSVARYISASRANKCFMTLQHDMRMIHLYPPQSIAALQWWIDGAKQLSGQV
jgi:hypothetical protein